MIPSPSRKGRKEEALVAFWRKKKKKGTTAAKRGMPERRFGFCPLKRGREVTVPSSGERGKEWKMSRKRALSASVKVIWEERMGRKKKTAPLLLVSEEKGKKKKGKK